MSINKVLSAGICGLNHTIVIYEVCRSFRISRSGSCVRTFTLSTTENKGQYPKMSKITDLIKTENKFTYSFEVTPDINEKVINDLTTEPLFFSVTWHAKLHLCKDLEIAPIKSAKFLRSKGKQVLMHLSCDLLRTDYLNRLLTLFQEIGVCNLLVLLGERYDPSSSDFKSTNELIAYIRNRTEKYFCIGVAGYPDTTDEKMLHMKEKVDSGADFILTQAFFEANVYKKFTSKCEQISISVPIIPGLFAFETYKQLTGFVDQCKVKVSNDFLEYVKNKGNESESVHSGVVLKELIQILRVQSNLTHFHFYTLNKLDVVSNFVKQF